MTGKRALSSAIATGLLLALAPVASARGQDAPDGDAPSGDGSSAPASDSFSDSSVPADPSSAPASPDSGTSGAALLPDSPAGETTRGGVEKGAVGVGLVIGLPTGIAAKLYLEDDRAVQAAVGINFVSGGVHLQADFVLHPYILQDKEEFTMPVYGGVGARFVQYREGRDGDHYFTLGARAVVGMLFDFKNLPLDVFLEIAPVLEYGFADDVGFELALDVGGGARYYF
jgi:hypothetical protein